MPGGMFLSMEEFQDFIDAGGMKNALSLIPEGSISDEQRKQLISSLGLSTEESDLKKKDQSEISGDLGDGTSDVEDGGLDSSEIQDDQLETEGEEVEETEGEEVEEEEYIPQSELTEEQILDQKTGELPIYRVNSRNISPDIMLQFLDDPDFIDSVISGKNRVYIKNSVSMSKILDEKIDSRKSQLEEGDDSKLSALNSEDSDLEDITISANRTETEEKRKERILGYGVDENAVDPREIYDYLIDNYKLSNSQAKGIIANIMSESRFDSSALGDYMIPDATGKMKNHERMVVQNSAGEWVYSRFHKTKAGKKVEGKLVKKIKHTSGGLFQHHDTRLESLINSAGKDWATNWKAQIDFAMNESEMLDYLASTNVVDENSAVEYFMRIFEKPSGLSAEDIKARQQILSKFKKFGRLPKKEKNRENEYSNIANIVIPADIDTNIEENFQDHVNSKLSQAASKNDVTKFLDIIFQGRTPDAAEMAYWQKYIRDNNLDSSLDIQQILLDYQNNKELQQYNYINDPNYNIPDYVNDNPILKKAYNMRKDYPFLPQDINNKLNDIDNGYESTRFLLSTDPDGAFKGKWGEIIFNAKNSNHGINGYEIDLKDLYEKGYSSLYTADEIKFIEEMYSNWNPYRNGIEIQNQRHLPWDEKSEGLFASTESIQDYEKRRGKKWSKISDEDKIKFYELMNRPEKMINDRLDNGWSHIGEGNYLHLESGVVLASDDEGGNPLLSDNGMKADIVEKLHKNPEFFKDASDEDLLKFYEEVFPVNAEWRNQKIEKLREKADRKPGLLSFMNVMPGVRGFPSKEEVKASRRQRLEVEEGELRDQVASLIMGSLDDVYNDVDAWSNKIGYYKDSDDAYEKFFAAADWLEEQKKLMDKYPKKPNGDPDLENMSNKQRKEYIDLHTAFNAVYNGSYQESKSQADKFSENPINKMFKSINDTNNRIIKYYTDTDDEYQLRNLYLINQRARQKKVDQLQNEGGLKKHLYNSGNVTENTVLKFTKGLMGLPRRVKGWFSDEENYDWTDELAEFYHYRVDYDEMKTPTELSTAWDYYEAEVDDYRVLVDRRGKVLQVITKDWMQVDPETSKEIIDKYKKNKEDYNVVKKQNNKAFWHQALQSGIDLTADIYITRRIAPLGTTERARRFLGVGTMMGTYNLKQYEDFRQKGLEQGMDQAQADDYANTVATLCSITQAINPNLNAFKIPAGMTTKTAFRAAVQDISMGGIGSSVIKKGIPRAIYEAGLEGLQEVAELETERLLNSTTYRGYNFDLERNMSEYKQAFVTGAMLGGGADVTTSIGQFGGAVFTKAGRSRLQLEGMLHAYENQQEFYEDLKSRIGKPTSINGKTVTLTDSQVDEKIQHFQNLFQQLDNVKSEAKKNGVEITGNHDKVLLDLIDRRNRLMSLQGVQDIDVRNTIESQLANVNNKINRILKGEKLADVIKDEPEFDLGVDEKNLSTAAKVALRKIKNEQEWNNIEHADVITGLESVIEKLEAKKNRTKEEETLLNIHKEILSDVKSIKPTINETRNKEDDAILAAAKKRDGKASTVAKGKAKTTKKGDTVKSVKEADGTTSTEITTKGGKKIKIKENGTVSVQGGSDQSIAGVITNPDGSTASVVLTDPSKLNSVKKKLAKLKKDLEAGKITPAEFEMEVEAMSDASLLTDPDLVTGAELSDVTSNLIKSGKISNITGSDVDAIIDEVVEEEQKTKYDEKGWLEWFKSLWRTRGLLPMKIFLRQRKMKSRIQMWESKLGVLNSRLLEAFESHSKKFGKKGFTVDQINEAFLDQMFEIDVLTDEINSLKNDLKSKSLPAKARRALNAELKAKQNKIKEIAEANKNKVTMMDILAKDEALFDVLLDSRVFLDNMSMEMLEAGVVPEAMIPTVQQNLGLYLTKQYRAHHDRDYHNLITELTDAVMSGKLTKDQEAKHVRELQILNKAIAYIKTNLDKQYEKERARHIETHPHLVDSNGEPISGKALNGTNIVAPTKITQGVIKAKIQEYFGKKGDSMFVAGIRENVSRDNIFIKRKDLPQYLEDLLSEIDNPVFNMVNTASNLINSLEINSYRADVVNMFEGDLLHTRPVGDMNTEIIVNGKKYYTYPGLAKEINGHLGSIDGGLLTLMNTPFIGHALKSYLKTLVFVKKGKTVWSFPTHVRNFTSNIGFAIANGHINPKTFWKGTSVAIQQFGMSSNADKQKAWQTMLEAGILSSSDLAEIDAIIALAGDPEYSSMFLNPESLTDQDWKRLKEKHPVMAWLGRKARGVDNAYMFEDIVWKASGFLHEVSRYQNAGYTYDQALEIAGQIVQNAYPTYDMLPPIAKAFRAAPVVGTFVSFPAEVIRTTAMTWRQIVREIKSDNKKVREIGYKRLAGSLTHAVGFPYLLKLALSGVNLAASMFGSDDEDEEKESLINPDSLWDTYNNKEQENLIRSLGPKWHKYSQIVTIKNPEPGVYYYWSMLENNPHGYIGEIINASVGEINRGKLKRLEEDFKEVKKDYDNGKITLEEYNEKYSEFRKKEKELFGKYTNVADPTISMIFAESPVLHAVFEPFIGEDILFAAVRDINENKDDLGKPIWQDADTSDVRFAKALGYMFKKVSPSAVQQILRLLASTNPNLAETLAEMDPGGWGDDEKFLGVNLKKDYDLDYEALAFFGGVRISRFDIRDSFKYNMMRANQELKEINPNQSSPSDVWDRTYEILEYIEHNFNAAWKLGLEQTVVESSRTGLKTGPFTDADGEPVNSTINRFAILEDINFSDSAIKILQRNRTEFPYINEFLMRRYSNQYKLGVIEEKERKLEEKKKEEDITKKVKRSLTK